MRTRLLPGEERRSSSCCSKRYGQTSAGSQRRCGPGTSFRGSAAGRRPPSHHDVDVTKGSYQEVATDLGRPISLGMDSASRTLFRADSLTGRVHVFRLENDAFKQAEAISTGLRTLSAVALGPDDTLFVADGYALYQLSLKTKKLTRVPY